MHEQTATAPIVVLGASGRTGGATARALLAHGIPVRAAVRDRTGVAARSLAAAGAAPVLVDLDRPDTLAHALEGARALFNVQAGFDSRGRYHADREVSQGHAVARAAARAGIELVVSLGAGPGVPTGLPHFDSKLTIRAAMADAGLNVITLFPAPFMELMTDAAFAPAASAFGAQPRVLGWDTRLPWVSVADIGAAAATCLTRAGAPLGASIPLVADLRSLRECRDLLALHGMPPKRVPLPVWAFRRLIGPELPDMWRWMRAHADAVHDTSPLRQLIGTPRTVSDWVTGHAAGPARTPRPLPADA